EVLKVGRGDRPREQVAAARRTLAPAARVARRLFLIGIVSGALLCAPLYYFTDGLLLSAAIGGFQGLFITAPFFLARYLDGGFVKESGINGRHLIDVVFA